MGPGNLFHAAPPQGGPDREPFSAVWEQIVRHEGEVFHIKRGGPLTYTIVPGGLIPSRTEYLLARQSFEKAWERMPLKGPGDLSDLRGPSYVYAILADPCIGGQKAGA